MFHRFIRCSLFLLGAAAAGCGGGTKMYPVEGTVTLDGQPLEGAVVTFTSSDGNAVATGVTSASGKFKLLSGGQEGAKAGTYKVTVNKTAVKDSAAAVIDTTNPTKSYTDFIKASGGKATDKGITLGKPKSEIPDRYGKAGSLPDQVIPASGEITIELKSK
jgi:hypothetical protein